MDRTILIVDDHPLFRKALANLVFDLVAEDKLFTASSAEEGLQIARESHFDLILLDLGLPGISGVDATRLFRRSSQAAILVISASEHRQEIAAVLRSGASAVVSKGVSMEVLRSTIQQALAKELPNQQWIRHSGALTFSDDAGRQLTLRQQEIASLLMNGHSNKEIGIRLGLAEITVKTHLTAVFRYLGVVNRTQAVVAIRRLGLDSSGGQVTTVD